MRSYDGTKSGRIILPIIKKARMYLWVCSPFLGPEYAELLKEKARSGTEVRVLTSQVADDRNHQRALDILSGVNRTQSYSTVAVAVVGLLMMILGLLTGTWLLTIAGLLVLGVGAYLSSTSRGRVAGKESGTEVKLQIARRFIHSKMYIADGEIAAVGSPNLTHGGLNRNMEHLEIYEGVESVKHVIKSYMASWNATA